MSLAEGVSARIAFKKYATGVITANAEPAIATNPGAAGGQILRRVSSSLKLAKDTYQSNEIRSDRQIADFRHGTRRVTGSISGELSPLTYVDLFEAAFRGTWEAALALSETDLTSVAADADDGTLTFGGGDPVALGLRVGHVFRLTDTSAPTDSGNNFVVLGFSGASNRTVEVYPPPPADMTADTAFDLATIGKRLSVPSTGHVSRKFAFEIFNEDIDVARLFTECRVGGFTMQLPASGMSTIEFPVMGRNMQVLQDTAAPYFTSPAAETSTGIFAAVNGLVRVNGVTQGVVTGVNIQMDLSPSSDAVVGQNFVPEVFLGRANVTGQMTAFFQDGDLVGAFTDEDEVSVLLYLTTESDPDTPAMTIFLPRIKFSDADVATSGEGGQSITLPFQALKSAGAPGIDGTTIQIVDTQIAA
ncbi:phage tail tube protein [Mesorhizobium sp.]|uniref:phage tail tube protein n=1 Tax=Mesorhizobium sp. TaxID=1871066 RepID=UPI0025DF8B2C|nr:phage tail tube protein [Mesorhizobium sp.]